ncbi:S8 family peptidase [Haladaptatus cibarius]|uniref:S8 family peptidase n=1 Tax=Haladaptatus cibarius TaxID=453847 RepID=UPI001186B947|nr:S8 family serine peptidase [Haladaptatus cibarius]
MSKDTTRRSFLKGAGMALGGLALTTQSVSASSTEDRYIIDLEDASDGVLDGLTVVHRLDQIGIAVVEGEESQVQGTRYSKDVEMELSQADKEYDEDDDDDDEDDDEDGSSKPSRFDLQWDKQAQEVLEAHEETRGEGTRVSVIDSGALETHPDLAGVLNTDLSKNFTGDGGDYNPIISDHGTHVSGIIAADGSSEDGILGTAPETDLVALRVFTGPFATFGDIIAAMVFSADIESDVANMSLGAYPLPKDADTALLRDSIERASSYANEQGTLIVAAAGNDGVNLDTDGDVISLPNEADNVMSISATGPIGYRWDDVPKEEEDDEDEDDDALENLRKPTTTPAPYTNYGEKAVDMSAPGGNYDESAPDTENWQYDMVLSTIFEWGDNGMVPAYGWKSGTSMAAPQVAATAALVKSENPNATPAQIRRHLIATAEDVDQPTYSGEGHLDTEEAVEEEIEDSDDDEDDYEDDDEDYDDDNHEEDDD